MPRIKKQQFQTFNDGILTICGAKGKVLTHTKARDIRFGYNVIGVRRHYEAKVISSQVDKLVAILMIPQGLLQTDVILISGVQYEIEQVQEKLDEQPPHHLIALRKVVTLYEDGRKEE